MTINLNPEHQKLIDDAISSGAYSDAAEVIGRALEMLVSEDGWLRENCGVIHKKTDLTSCPVFFFSNTWSSTGRVSRLRSLL